LILLDTNVIAETMRPAPDPGVLAWLLAGPGDLALSTVVIAEIAFGIGRIRPEQRASRLEANLNHWISRLEGNILVFDLPCALICGEIRGQASRRGRPMDALDAMIAATAMRHGAALATRNTRDFDIPGLVLIDAWSA
jgi:predicted nucleic acid-binding protein